MRTATAAVKYATYSKTDCRARWPKRHQVAAGRSGDVDGRALTACLLSQRRALRRNVASQRCVMVAAASRSGASTLVKVGRACCPCLSSKPVGPVAAGGSPYPPCHNFMSSTQQALLVNRSSWCHSITACTAAHMRCSLDQYTCCMPHACASRMQICGVTNPEDAQLAVDAGADFIGAWAMHATRAAWGRKGRHGAMSHARAYRWGAHVAGVCTSTMCTDVAGGMACRHMPCMGMPHHAGVLTPWVGVHWGLWGMGRMLHVLPVSALLLHLPSQRERGEWSPCQGGSVPHLYSISQKSCIVSLCTLRLLHPAFAAPSCVKD